MTSVSITRIRGALKALGVTLFLGFGANPFIGGQALAQTELAGIDALGAVTSLTGTESSTSSDDTGTGQTTVSDAFVRIEQNDPSVSYSGTWFVDEASGHSGGEAALAMESGARAMLTFTGSEVRWIGFRDEWSGIAEVFIDGVHQATVDTYAAGSQSQVVLFSKSGLAAASHTLTIEVTGSRGAAARGDWVWIDAFEVNPRFEQDHAAVSFSGPWFASNERRIFSGGNAALSMDAGAVADFSFNGTGVRWIGFRDEWSGIADVFLDGVYQTTVDTFATETQAQQVMFSADGLPAGNHALTVEVRGQSNADAKGAWVWVDAFEIDGGSQSEPPPDTAPPAAAMTSPADGSTVSGTVTVSADASDNAAVAGVQFLLDGVALGGEDTSAPFEIQWDTTSAADGSHELSAVARDSSGNTGGSAAVTVTVSNGPGPDATPPSVTITSPEDRSHVSGRVTITADAFDNAGVVGVRFTASGFAVGDEDTTAPYSAVWDTRDLIDGDDCRTNEDPHCFHRLEAVARDEAGNTSRASILVWVDKISPDVSITSPSPGSTVSGTVTVTADASDNGEVVLVRFFDGGTLIGEDSTAPYTAPWDTTTGAEGNHSLTAVGQDKAGNTTTSSAVTVTVQNDAPPTATRVEEDDPSVAFSGSWSQGSTARPFSGGTAALSAEAGARATFSFDGTRADWIGFRGPQTGIANVYVDGALAAEVDTYSATEETEAVLFTTGDLPSGAHTVSVEVAGSKNAQSSDVLVVVDAFDISGGGSGGPPPTESERIEEHDPRVVFAGPWFPSNLESHSEGMAAKAFEAEASATLTFEGTGVSFISFRDENTGIARIFLDGVFQEEVDTYSAGVEPQAVVYTAQGLAPGTHTLTVEVTGEFNPAGNAAWIGVDAFDVVR